MKEGLEANRVKRHCEEMREEMEADHDKSMMEVVK